MNQDMEGVSILEDEAISWKNLHMHGTSLMKPDT
jgi:hypothetical protein